MKRKRKQRPAHVPDPLSKYEKLPDYNNMYGQCRTQDELRDFFQKSDLQWGYKKHEQGI